MNLVLDASQSLPKDRDTAVLVGRAWIPGKPGGPSVVAVRDDSLVLLDELAPTMAQLLERAAPVGDVREVATRAPVVASLADAFAHTPPESRDAEVPYLLAPVDLQAVRACGVTFVRSLLERVIEEHVRGDPAEADAVRSYLAEEIGGSLNQVRPGSPEAARLKAALVERDLWSQYLEVGIGPDVEVFTKCPPMASVGTGVEVGIHPQSVWNNPEPEVVLVVNPAGKIVGASLGNDTNLRDFEGRSALLLGRAKDNAASSAIGPFIRLLDDSFGLDDVRVTEVSLLVEGDDGFRLEATSSMAEISRDIEELVGQTIDDHHQYPDGLALYTGTMFAPTEDRGKPGGGFTHKLGDLVTISAPRLGSLVNRVNHTDKVERWEFGASWLMRNLAARGFI